MAIEVPAKKWNTKNEQLLSTVIKGELSGVKRLVERGIADINYKNKHGHSCLQLAIIHGHFKLAEYLIHKGVDIHSIDSEGWTALHDAALRNSKTLARKLISKGCSTTQTTNLGELPIDLAGSVHMEKFLCKEMSSRGERELALQYCVYLGLHCLGDADSFSLDELEESQPVSVHRRSKTKDYSNSKSSQKTGGSTSVGVSSNDLTRLQETTQDLEVSSQTRSSRLECAIIDRPPPPYESRYRPREAVVINSLPQHSCKRQLQDFDSFCASLSISKSDLVVPTKHRCDLPKVDQSRLQQSEAPLEKNTDSSLADPLRRVHFATATEPMARTKAAHSCNSPITEKKESDSSPVGLSPEDVKHLTEIFEGGRGTTASPTSTSVSSDSDPDPEVVAQLKMRPRKSSIASPDRRHSGVRVARRSVTFQPEVLLQNIVTVGDVKEVHEILSSGMIPDVNKMSPAGLTALHQSAVDGNLDCAKALVINGANVNSVDCEKWTPLHAAAMTGHADLVRFLLQSGADATLKNEDGETAYDVAKTGPIRKMLLCVMNGKNEEEFSDGEYSGEEEEVYSHAESDSDSGEDDNACIFGSSSEERKPSLKERLGLNHSVAFKNITRDSSVSPSPDLEQSSDSVFITSPVFNFPRRSRNISDSTSSCEPELERIRELDERTLNTESDTDKVSEDQGISTMEGGSSDCSHRGRTFSEDEGTSRDFLDTDLKPDSLDYRFQEAVLYCDVDSVLKLVKHKSEINVNRVNKASGITALHHAVLEENFVIVQHLVKDFGASLHVKDTDGYTPLHAASAVGSLRIAQFLLDNGAKPSVLNNSCEFPVDLAEDEAMEKLLKHAMLGPGVGKIFKGIFT